MSRFEFVPQAVHKRRLPDIIMDHQEKKHYYDLEQITVLLNQMEVYANENHDLKKEIRKLKLKIIQLEEDMDYCHVIETGEVTTEWHI